MQELRMHISDYNILQKKKKKNNNLQSFSSSSSFTFEFSLTFQIKLISLP